MPWLHGNRCAPRRSDFEAAAALPGLASLGRVHVFSARTRTRTTSARGPRWRAGLPWAGTRGAKAARGAGREAPRSLVVVLVFLAGPLALKQQQPSAAAPQQLE
ncbi:unnamed protein product, partial [Prorocentrum cordatum]